jgi:hypothetical protein
VSTPAGREGKGKEGSAHALEFHESLPKQSWDEWLTHRRSKRWPIDALTLQKQLNVLAKHPADEQAEMIDNSINSGWQGIFPLKKKPGAKASYNPYAGAE